MVSMEDEDIHRFWVFFLKPSRIQVLKKFLKVFGLSASIIGMAWVIWLQGLLSLGYEIHLVPDFFLYDVFLNPWELVIFIVGLGSVTHYWGIECGINEYEDRFIEKLKKLLGRG